MPVPVPPKTLTRALPMLRDDVPVTPETLSAFQKAGLWRPFDPLAVLPKVATGLSDPACSDARKREVLTWAFRLWRADEVDADRLPNPGCTYRTRGGWRPAGTASFPASWTIVGTRLESYLLAARDVSPDCRAAYNTLLVDPGEWPVIVGRQQAEWGRDSPHPSWRARRA